jgi:short-subunit dehydrogenase
MTKNVNKPLAIVTGASTGIGYELAKRCAENGFDLIVAADEPEIEHAAEQFRLSGANVEAVEADLATIEGVERLYAAANGRSVDALLANAGRGLGDAFLDEDFNQVIRVIDTNITGTIYLIQRVARDMRDRGEGRILITGSIAGFSPAPLHAVYHGTKAFIDSFSFALRNELRAEKDDPADVAKTGFEAMMKGEGDVVSGWQNKLQSAMANVTPASILAKQTRKQYEPGSAKS